MCTSFGRLRRSKEIPGMELRKLTCSLAAVSHPVNKGVPGLLGEWLLPLPLPLLDAGPACLSFWFCSARLLACCLLAPLQTFQPSSGTFSSARFPSCFQAHNDGAGGSMLRAQVWAVCPATLAEGLSTCPHCGKDVFMRSWHGDVHSVHEDDNHSSQDVWRWEGAGPRKVWFLTRMYTYMHLHTYIYIHRCIHFLFK